MAVVQPDGTTTSTGIVGQEPVVIINTLVEVVTELIRNSLLLLIGFGIVAWTDVQIALVMAVVGSFLAAVKVIANVVFVRPRTTPTANPTVPSGTVVNVTPAADGTGAGTTTV